MHCTNKKELLQMIEKLPNIRTKACLIRMPLGHLMGGIAGISNWMEIVQQTQDTLE